MSYLGSEVSISVREEFIEIRTKLLLLSLLLTVTWPEQNWLFSNEIEAQELVWKCRCFTIMPYSHQERQAQASQK